jgi:hypothetical protein
MAKPDDLEAVRTIAGTLSGFSPEEQERILRWVREKVGLAPSATRFSQEPRVPPPGPAAPASPGLADQSTEAHTPGLNKDLKSFVTAKNPRSDVQFAATVAYFHRFEALPDQRKNEIDADTIQDACRLAGRARLKSPLITLNNAKKLGLLDSGSEKGRFTINTVGENLVAMTLPGQADAKRSRSQKAKKSPATTRAKRK